MSERADRARGVARHQIALEHTISGWQEQVSRFAKLVGNGCDPAIIEAARLDCVFAFEAMLDGVKTMRDALTLLDLARNQTEPRLRGAEDGVLRQRRPAPPKPKPDPSDGKPPKDDA